MKKKALDYRPVEEIIPPRKINWQNNVPFLNELYLGWVARNVEPAYQSSFINRKASDNRENK